MKSFTRWLDEKSSKFKSIIITGALVALSYGAWAGQLFQVNFQATFDSGFGGLPAVPINGSYTFELRPPTQNDGISANYAMQSATFTLNGLKFDSASEAFKYLRVDNNIGLSGGAFRDAYYSFASLDGAFSTGFLIQGAGLSFEQVGASPSAFGNIGLPTSVGDLAGFGASDARNAVLVFRNLALGYSFATYAPVTALSIIPIPEPSFGSLAMTGLGAIFLRFRRLR
jgi:hypothetical protein